MKIIVGDSHMVAARDSNPVRRCAVHDERHILDGDVGAVCKFDRTCVKNRHPFILRLNDNWITGIAMFTRNAKCSIIPIL
ncbi:hypothetical protein D3C85_1316410 [compost metagenome]